jgi:L-ascorbate metabolism protein UlaG (beta-lactamase superfamily)
MKETALNVGSVSIYKTPGKHGVITPCGEASGIIFKATDEKTLYIAGDTVWFEGVKNTLDKYKPDIIALNACAAELIGFGRLIMNDEDVETVSKISPDSKIIITHMDNVSHASITRFTMRSLLRKRDIKEYFMPEDGETLVF